MGIKKQTETALVKAVIEYLRLRGIPAWRFNSGGTPMRNAGGLARFVRFNTAPGCSDILGVLPESMGGGGRMLACEVKRPGNIATAQQGAFLDAVRAAGGVAVCVSSLDQLIEELRSAGVNL